VLGCFSPCDQFISLKIQTNDLEKIKATSADNIEMSVTSTVNWRITDENVAGTMAAETMNESGKRGSVSADITKLRNDVLKQAIASLAGFVGSVNYSNTVLRHYTPAMRMNPFVSCTLTFV